ncbi:MAG: tetratricopeptide repeat protein [Planctomycetota bacterium]
MSYDRARVTDHGFAENETNRLQIDRVALGDTIRPAMQNRALDLAHRALDHFREAPVGLEIARDLARQVAELEQGQHMEARLLLARSYEVEFRFEEAFDVYHELLQSSEYAGRPEVLVAAGGLHARLGAAERAEGLFRQALNSVRGNSGALYALGDLLMTEGRAEEALPYLEQAEAAEPRGVENKARRIAIRTRHGACLLALGRASEARAAYGRALSLDETHPASLAGALQAARILPAAERDAALTAALGQAQSGAIEGSFELSLALGQASLDRGQWAAARRHLELAAGSDPFRAHLAYGALANLAEVAQQGERALGYLDEALTIAPEFAWAHATRGRLLREQGDLAGAEAALQRALELELDFPDALVEMARVKREGLDYAAAELYLERALELDPQNASWLALRGFNAYDRRLADQGRDLFQAALSIDSDLAEAGLAEAWWHYLAGDSTEAITRFGEWIERRRAMGAEDPYVMYAEAQSARIRDHDSKELWTDRFERRPGRIGNGWSVKEGLGPTVELTGGEVRFEGQITAAGRTRLYNELSADSFLSMEGRVKIGSRHRGADVGFFLARERSGHAGDVVAQAEVDFQRNADGVYQYRLMTRGEADAPWVDLPGRTQPQDQFVTWTLEKVGVGSDAYIRLFIDGELVAPRLTMPTLGSATQVLRFGLYVEGQVNREADVTLDDVRVVRRRLGGK